MNPDLLSAPTEIVVAFGVGYLSYQIAFYGNNRAHSTTHTLALASVFAAIAIIAVRALIGLGLQLPEALTLGSIPPIVSAAIWRWTGHRAAEQIMRQSKLSHSLGESSAWHRLPRNTKVDMTQISVKTKDGYTYHCDHLDAFRDLPYGPCMLGYDGDVCLYVTSIVDPEGNEFPQDQTHVPGEWGSQIYYIPASEISLVTARHWDPNLALTEAEMAAVNR